MIIEKEASLWNVHRLVLVSTVIDRLLEGLCGVHLSRWISTIGRVSHGNGTLRLGDWLTDKLKVCQVNGDGFGLIGNMEDIII